MASIRKRRKSFPGKTDGLFMFFLVLGAGFLFLFSLSTSPFTSNSWGSDSAFFQFAGFSTAKGQIMYRDIFDTKGPYLFFLQQLAYMIGEENGRYILFFIQFICMAVSLLILDASCRLFYPERNKWRVVSVLLYFFMLAYTLDGGNLTEEYGLPLLFFCQYLMLKTVIQRTECPGDDCVGTYPMKYTFCYGVCFGILAFIRITNSCLICCILLFCSMNLLIKKQWIELIKHAAVFLLGSVAAVLPIVLWYAFHGALDDMLYATYVFAFSYATEKAGQLRLGMYGPLLLLCLAGILLNIGCKKEKDMIHESDRALGRYLLICLVFHTVILLFGKSYVHYYQLVIPPALCAFWCIAGKCREKRLWVLLAVIVMMNLMPFTAHAGRIVAAAGLNTEKIHASPIGKLSERLLDFDTSRVSYGYQTEQAAKELLKQIPADGQDSIYSNSPTWFLLVQRLSDCKYPETPGSFMMISEQIYGQMQEWFSMGRWDYVVMEKKDDFCLENMLEKYYQKVAEKDMFVMYKFTGQQA